MLIGPQNSASAALLAQRLSEVRATLAAAATTAGRSEHSVTLLAVSKGHGPDVLRSAAELGVEHFGESYVQEALPKIAALKPTDLAPAALHWHFIGRLQANKTRDIAQHFHWVHGIDRRSLAERLSVQRPATLPPLNVCLQINVAGEQQKAGIAPAAAADLAGAVSLLPGLRLRGLMCIPPEHLTAMEAQRHYASLHQLLLELNRKGLALDTLSMGMSGDFPAAIAAGATIVRVGTAIFGERRG